MTRRDALKCFVCAMMTPMLAPLSPLAEPFLKKYVTQVDDEWDEEEESSESFSRSCSCMGGQNCCKFRNSSSSISMGSQR